MRALLAAAITIGSALALPVQPAPPCSAFLVVGSDQVLFGNNEDYLNPETRVRFVPPSEGRRGVMYLGFDDGFPQGGMNDAGLAFDGFATAPKPMKHQENKRKFDGNPVVEVMETCATVEEAVAFLEKVDLRPILTNAMVFLADANGDSVIIEGDDFLRKNGEFQAVTNFYQSEHEDDAAQCPRYAAILRVLEARKTTSTEVCERALAAATIRTRTLATLYSNVFDLRARTANLYLFQDFEHPVAIDLAKELEKGARTLELAELFGENAAWEDYAAYRRMPVEKKIAMRAGPTPTAAELAACEGIYELELDGTSWKELEVDGRPYSAVISREGDALRIACPVFEALGEHLELHPESATVYFYVGKEAEFDLRFRVGDDGKSASFTLEVAGEEFKAERVAPTGEEHPSRRL
jgi:hypothetical protein